MTGTRANGLIENPDFCADGLAGGLEAEWERMWGSPKGLTRPLVMFSGWRAMGFPVKALGGRLAELAGADAREVLSISFVLCHNFESACRRAVAKVEERWPSGDAEQTVEVDVVGVSMGGIVARAAASAMMGRLNHGTKRLRIGRLFTMASPHRGATLAQLAKGLCPDGTSRDMRPGCDFLCRLNAEASEHELVCYARLRDWWVGATNTAPPGQEPIWVDAPALTSHQLVTQDPLIRTDIARRLRGEEPLGRPSKPPRD